MHFAIFVIASLLFLDSCAHSHKSKFASSHAGNLLDVNWVAQNPGKPHSMTIAEIEGRKAVRFEIRQSEGWTNKSTGNKTYRSEINTYEFVPMGSLNWYKFSIYLPTNFPIEDNRLCLAQWWAKTKTHLGEVHRSPILQLRFAAGTMAILMRRYPDMVTIDDEAYVHTRMFETNKFALG